MTIYYSIVNSDHKTSSLTFKLGLNATNKPFGTDADEILKATGFYFTDLENLGKFLIYDTHLALVEPKGQIYKHKTNLCPKTDQIYVYDIRSIPEWFESLSEAEKLRLMPNGFDSFLEEYPGAIQLVKNPTEEQMMDAVKKNWRSVRFIQNPSKEVQLAAVRGNGYALQYIEDPSEDVKLYAVQLNGYTIQYIKTPSEEIQRESFKQDGNSIRFIKTPSEAVQLIAVELNGYALKFITNPSYEVQLAAVKSYGYALEFIENPSEEMQRIAIMEDPNSLQFIKNPSEEIMVLAAGRGCRLHHFKNLTREVQLAAVEFWDNAIESIESIIGDATEEVQLAAIRKNHTAIQCIKNPTETVKLAAQMAVLV